MLSDKCLTDNYLLKLMTETPEHCVKSVQTNVKDTKMTLITNFTYCSGISVAELEQNPV